MTNVRFQTLGLNTTHCQSLLQYCSFYSWVGDVGHFLFCLQSEEWEMLYLNCKWTVFFFCSQTSPNKAEFIRAKYQMLAFVHRLPCRDDDSVTAKDLSKVGHTF